MIQELIKAEMKRMKAAYTTILESLAQKIEAQEDEISKLKARVNIGDEE